MHMCNVDINLMINLYFIVANWISACLCRKAGHKIKIFKTIWLFSCSLYKHKAQDLVPYISFQVVSDAPWYNLSKQQYQPSVPSCLSDTFVEPILNARKEEGSSSCIDENVLQLITTGCVQHYSLDAFAGGGCLQITRPCSQRKSQRWGFYQHTFKSQARCIQIFCCLFMYLFKFLFIQVFNLFILFYINLWIASWMTGSYITQLCCFTCRGYVVSSEMGSWSWMMSR